MSQQRFTPSTGTHARPTSHAVSVVHVPGRHALVSAQTGAPETSGRQRVRRPRQSERPHGVPDTDGMHGINRLSVSAMNESTVSSTLAALLPFGLKQPPLASARANVVRNAASAWARQSGLTALFRRTAIAWHRSLASLFRSTALSFASAHFIARRADDDSAPFAGAAPRTTPTSTAVATFIRILPSDATVEVQFDRASALLLHFEGGVTIARPIVEWSRLPRGMSPRPAVTTRRDEAGAGPRTRLPGCPAHGPTLNTYSW